MPPVPSSPIVARIRSFEVTPGAELAGVVDPHRLRPSLDQGLGCHHVLDLGGADAESEGAEGAVGGGVGVAADDRHARLGQAEFRTDHVDDALGLRAEAVDRHAEVLGILLQRLDLLAGERVGDQLGGRGAVGRHVVVGGRNRLVRATQLAAGHPQAFEGLGRGDLVDQMEIDVDQLLPDLMRLPDLFEHRLRHFSPS